MRRNSMIKNESSGIDVGAQVPGFSDNSLNKDRIKTTRDLETALYDDAGTEGWKEIRPVTAGMFARAAYPTDKIYYMTYRFDLKECIDASALKQAWEKTIKVYPYVTYATVVRRNMLVFTEDPLPFVFGETGEVIEPSTPEANFHTVTICYLDNIVRIYVDHVPYDGTGFMHVLETFFYHYYSITDEREYPVPEGVHTEAEGAVPGQDTDAYLELPPMDPTELMTTFREIQVFETPESPRDCLFVPEADCREFCISIPSAGFMDYSKSVKGSPMSVLYVCFAKALQRIHPENKAPFSFMVPVSIRKVMGNTDSLLHQVVHFNYSFNVLELSEKTDEELNTEFRAALSDYSREKNIKKAAGVYRSICEGNTKAYIDGTLNKIIMDQRKNPKVGAGVSYLGTMRTGDYGSRIRMTAFHTMPDRGITLQVTEVGGYFYIDWYQGFHSEDYVLAMRDILAEKGICGIKVEGAE